MPRPTQNVIQLYPGRSPQHLPSSLERLGVAWQEFQGLRRCIEQLVRDPRWSALEWRAANTPLMLRLPGVRQSLADLAEIRASRWPDTDWAVRFSAARHEVERRLLGVSMSMSVLAYKEISGIDSVINFSSDGAKLAEAVQALCALIANQYPAVIGDI